MTIQTQPIFYGEPIRYQDKSRWLHNNGFRRRWLANGAVNAAVINAARRGDVNAVLAFVDTLGGVSQRKGLARSIIKDARALPEDARGHWVQQSVGRCKLVMVPHVSWRWKGGKQIADIRNYALWGTRP
jgi:hypothetical protein